MRDQKSAKSNGARDRCGIYRRRRRRTRTYGALDLGTNNCRLLVARPTVEGFRVITSFSRIVRLGEGLANGDSLSEEAMSRAIDALKVCAEKIENFKVSRCRGVATEACRRADNKDEFLGRIEEATGLTLEIVSSDEEARLALAGCQSLLSADSDYALVFDIGGGSTELIWATCDEEGFDVVDILSLPFGVVTLAEQCGTNSIPSRLYDDIVGEVAHHLPDFCRRNAIRRKVDEGQVQMLGTSGTVTTLGAIHLDLPAYSRARIDGLHLQFEELKSAASRLTCLDYENRAAIPCIGHERAELVVPGCAILEAICRFWPVGKLRVADRGLREGILLELMAADRRGTVSA